MWYLAEQYQPGTDIGELRRATARRLADAAASLTADGVNVRFAGASFVSSDESCPDATSPGRRGLLSELTPNDGRDERRPQPGKPRGDAVPVNAQNIHVPTSTGCPLAPLTGGAFGLGSRRLRS